MKNQNMIDQAESCIIKWAKEYAQNSSHKAEISNINDACLYIFEKIRLKDKSTYKKIVREFNSAQNWCHFNINGKIVSIPISIPFRKVYLSNLK